MSERDVVESEAGLVFFHELDRLVDPDKDTEALCRVLDMRPSEETFYAARVIRAQAAEITSMRAVVERQDGALGKAARTARILFRDCQGRLESAKLTAIGSIADAAEAAREGE